MIDLVILWSNGMVTVFGKDGEQIPDYQGRFLDERQNILSNAPDSARFQMGQWGGGMVDINREAFASPAWNRKQ
jgi:hypothetical protein